MNLMQMHLDDLTVYKRRDDLSQRNRLIADCLPLVIHMAKRFHSKRMTLEDKISHGHIALCKAADKYDKKRKSKYTKKQVKFSHYAARVIENHLSVAEWDEGHSGIRLPLQTIKRMKAIQEFAEEHGRIPTYVETKVMWSRFTFQRYQQIMFAYWSTRTFTVEPDNNKLNDPVGEGGIRRMQKKFNCED